MHGSPGEDLLIGTKVVAEATDEEVQRMGQMALRREAVLTAVIAFLHGADVGRFETPKCE